MNLNLLRAVNSGKRWTAVCAVVLAMAVTLISQTTQRANRITHELNSGPAVTISGTVHPLTRQASDLLGKPQHAAGVDDAEHRAERGRKGGAGCSRGGAAESEVGSVSPVAYAGGVRNTLWTTEADLSQVTGWLETQGFTVKSVAPSRNLITFSGTVAQAERAFHTQIHQYRIGVDTRISNAREIALPQGLADVLAGVGGMSGFRPKPRAVVKHLDPQFTSQFSGNHFLRWATGRPSITSPRSTPPATPAQGCMWA